MKCWKCPHYRKGKGSRACKPCDEFKNITPRSAPCVDYQTLPSEMLENLSLPHMKDYYSTLAPDEAVLIFRKFHLEQTEKELAEIHNITRQAVAKKIKNILTFLSTYAKT